MYFVLMINIKVISSYIKTNANLKIKLHKTNVHNVNTN